MGNWFKFAIFALGLIIYVTRLQIISSIFRRFYGILFSAKVKRTTVRATKVAFWCGIDWNGWNISTWQTTRRNTPGRLGSIWLCAGECAYYWTKLWMGKGNKPKPEVAPEVVHLLVSLVKGCDWYHRKLPSYGADYWRLDCQNRKTDKNCSNDLHTLSYWSHSGWWRCTSPCLRNQGTKINECAIFLKLWFFMIFPTARPINTTNNCP